jgi:hypothetical protein
MPTPPSLPSLPGLGWSVHKKPIFSTTVNSHVSGREVRNAHYVNPLWEFELTYDGLDSSNTYPGLQNNSLQTLMGLYLQCGGQRDTFLYTDSTDSSVTDQLVGVGTGSATQFTLQRTLGGFTEPAGWVNTLTGVKVNGSPLSGGQFSLTTPNTLVLVTPPGAGLQVAATFTYSFICRFLEDSVDFEQFMSSMWTVKSLRFRSVRS